MTTDYTWMFLRMVFALGAVSVLAILILKYILPKWIMPRKLRENQFFRVTSRFDLGQRKHLFLVEAGKKTYILGVSDNSINLISEVENENEKKEGLS